MPGRGDPLLTNVSYALVPIAALADFELGRSFPPIQMVGQEGGLYYMIAVPRLLRGRWSVLNRILDQREAIHDLGLVDNLYNYLHPGFSGIAISPDGSLHVYSRGECIGEARFTGPGRRGGYAAANRAVVYHGYEGGGAEFGEWPMSMGQVSIDAIARGVMELAPGFVQRPVYRAVGAAQTAMALASRARRMLPSRPRLTWRR